ncbi:MAG: alpha-ketoacid dehydrogenase subunit beta [Actinomycetota bacterium]|nr:alpha-ketoacid dehydrogenase subunit beta [Actinomycetota bacterium]
MSTPDEPRPRRRREPTYLDALTFALDAAMDEDPRVIVMGEDIAGGAGTGEPFEGQMGGTWGVTKGLFAKYGPTRVRDTPISEAAIVGSAVGAAMAGLRPVVDLMWASFAPYAFDQIVNQAAKARYMFGGQAQVPLVIRMSVGAGLRAGGQHSDSHYALFAAIPGLKVVAPATPNDAAGLLLSAIRSDDPVIFLEHMSLYRLKGALPDSTAGIPLGTAEVARMGSDLTIVTIGASRQIALLAATQLALEGIEAEVVDLRSLRPIDWDTILESVNRTGRLVLVEESPAGVTISDAIAAEVNERLFGRLKAPVRRVLAAASPVPFSPPLEDAWLPTAERVLVAARLVCDRLPAGRD